MKRFFWAEPDDQMVWAIKNIGYGDIDWCHMEWWEEENKETILPKIFGIKSLTLSMLGLLVIYFWGGCVLCSKRFKRFFFGISLESLVP